MAKWLRSRPRWTATFVGTWLQKTKKVIYCMPPGNFTSDEAFTVEAITQYTEKATRQEGNPGHRISWTLDGVSAYAMIQTQYYQKAEFETQHALLGQVKDAVFRYAFTGKPKVMRDKTAETIQTGVASIVESRREVC